MPVLAHSGRCGAAPGCSSASQRAAVLGKLDEFRGDSRFTTWAYKFALFEAGTKLRRRAWQGREVPLEPESWSLLAQAGATPHADAETAELLSVLQEAIRTQSSPHQRSALYKTVHAAQQKLRRVLAARGLAAGADMEDRS